MGKKGIPMTIMMQAETAPNVAQPMGPDADYTGTWGSLYYEKGQAVMTTSTYRIKQAGGEVG
ncbi:MAG: hypothetical protein MJZ73_01305 [Bacteroidaceae bacterium]|nr:hypothetical protein [Bacteroidaceae bacterium]